jgi:hypothetical protein
VNRVTLALGTVIGLVAAPSIAQHVHELVEVIHPDDVDGTGLWRHTIRPDEPFDAALLSWVPAAGVEDRAWPGRELGWSGIGFVLAGWPWLIDTRGDGAPPLADPAELLKARVHIDVDMIEFEKPQALLDVHVVHNAPRPRVFATLSRAGPEITPDDGLALSTRVWDVPFRRQADAGRAIGGGPDGEPLAGRVCSPTAVAMVLAAKGVDVPVRAVCEAAYDPRHDVYGNWVRNTWAGSRLGVPMIVTRLSSWTALAEWLEHGPVVVSLPPFDGESLPEAGYVNPEGHLIVVRGLDGNGGVLVTDPAYGEQAKAERVYPVRALTELWLKGKLGTCYVVLPDEGPASAE